MNKFDCAFAHLAYNPNVDYKKCTAKYVNRKRVSYTIVYKNGKVASFENVSWRSHGKMLWNLYLDTVKKVNQM